MSTHKLRAAEGCPHNGTPPAFATPRAPHPPETTSNTDTHEAGSMCNERIAYKVAQAARVMGVSRYVLYDAIREKQLPAYEPNPGGDFLILVEDLRAWIKRHPAQPRGRRRPGNAADV